MGILDISAVYANLQMCAWSSHIVNREASYNHHRLVNCIDSYADKS